MEYTHGTLLGNTPPHATHATHATRATHATHAIHATHPSHATLTTATCDDDTERMSKSGDEEGNGEDY